MSHSAYLLHASPAQLAAVVAYAKDPSRSLEALVRPSLQHHRIAAASERAIRSVTSASDRFLLASRCQPYLLAATEPEVIVEQLATLETTADDRALDEFFAAELRQLGLVRGKLGAVAPPSLEAITAAVKQRLDYVAHRYDLKRRGGKTLAIDGGESAVADPGDYGLDVWIAIAEVLARGGPVWWQGRERSLLDHVSLASPWPLLGELNVLGAEAELPRETAGVITYEALPKVIEIVAKVRTDWRTIVLAAAAYAQKKHLTLIESDHVFPFPHSRDG